MTERMRYPWEGQLVFSDAPSIDRDLHVLGLPHRFLEAVEGNALPQYEGDAEKRWSVEGLADERRQKRGGFHIQGRMDEPSLPRGLVEVASGILHDWVVYGVAGLERNVVEDTPPVPAIMHLPGWSLEVTAEALQQRVEMESGLATVARGVAFQPPPKLVDPIRKSLEELVKIAMAERTAMSRFPDAMLRKSAVQPLEAIRKLEFESFRVTTELGYVPSYSQVRLTPEYRFFRAIRMRRHGLRLRAALLDAFNDALRWYGNEEGLGRAVALRFAEAWTDEDLVKLESDVLNGRISIERGFDWLGYGPKPTDPRPIRRRTA